MGWRPVCNVLVLISLVGLFATSNVSGATIVGNVYAFQFGRIVQNTEGHGLLHTHIWDGNFQLSIRDQTTDGQIYTVNYYGYYFSSSPSLQNSTYDVDFKRNFVYFELNAYDNNDDNYAEYAHVERYPAFTDLANVILVNPEWLNHSGLWGYAVETMNLHPCVNHNVSHAFKDDLGTFQYLIVVNFRGLVGIGGDTHNVNGTKSFAHSSHYDTDGVLLEYQFEVASHYYCLEGEWFESIKFLIMRGATHPFSYPLNPTLSFLLVGMVVIPFGVGLGIGIGIGVLFRRRYQESSQSDT